MRRVFASQHARRCLGLIVPHIFQPSENRLSIPPGAGTAGLAEEAPVVPPNGTASCTAFDRLVKSRPSAAVSSRAPAEGIAAASHSRKHLKGRFTFEGGDTGRTEISAACRTHKWQKDQLSNEH